MIYLKNSFVADFFLSHFFFEPPKLAGCWEALGGAAIFFGIQVVKIKNVFF